MSHNSDILTRFAPSPTGYLHLGHAFAAKEAFNFGPCLLRVEDIDHTRCKPEYEAAIYEDLKWLGFKWPQPVRVQSKHISEYDAVIERLREMDLVYRCFKSRKETLLATARNAAKNGRGALLYQGPETPLTTEQEEEKIAAGIPFSWRISIAKSRDYLGDSFDALSYMETGFDDTLRPPGERLAHAGSFGDEILARKDIGTSYHIAVCHDDALQNITHVVRGTDLARTTGFHRLLQELMGWPTPVYHHHPLLLGGDGEKLAKRKNDTAILSYRLDGLSPAQVKDMARYDGAPQSTIAPDTLSV
ncbi:MAG: tRNA glutamyl-Q(34) synthetase GluQRS [Maricaulaceae bacterium]